MSLLKKVATRVLEKYREALPEPTTAEPVFKPGTLALLYRPHSSKLFVRSTGPYLVLSSKGSTVVL